MADVRIITATNLDLEHAVREGRFREDLYYRFNVIQIEIPPLRGRPEDVAHLARLLLAFWPQESSGSFKVSTQNALQGLKEYEWPGNVRELSNIIERQLSFANPLVLELNICRIELLTAWPDLNLGTPQAWRELKRSTSGGFPASTKSLQEAAEILGIEQATLWRRRKQYKI